MMRGSRVWRGRQSSRRQSHRRDIVPPIAIYIHPLQPTLCFCHPHVSIPFPSSSSLPPPQPSHSYPLLLALSLSISFRWLGWTHPSQRPLLFAFHFNQPPSAASPPLSIYEDSTPLLTLRHHCAFATVPQCSLGLGALARGLSAGATGGRLSAALLPRRSVYMVPLRGGRFFTSFFARRRVGIRRARGFGIPRRFAAPRSTAALAPALHRCATIDISVASKLLPLRESLFALKNQESQKNKDRGEERIVTVYTTLFV